MHHVDRTTYVVVDRNGELQKVYSPPHKLMPPLVQFGERSKIKGGETYWGDWYRVMKRRRHDPHVVSHCKKTGEELWCSRTPSDPKLR